MIPDPNGPIERIGKGVYRDVGAGTLMERSGSNKDGAVPAKTVQSRKRMKEIKDTMKTRKERKEELKSMSMEVEAAEIQDEPVVEPKGHDE